MALNRRQRRRARNRRRARTLGAANRPSRQVDPNSVQKQLRGAPATSGATGGGLSVGRGRLGRETRRDERFGESLVNRFLPNLDTLGTVDASRAQETTNFLNELRAQADTAGSRSQELKDIIATQQGGLGGLLAEENTALREGAQRELDRGFSSQLRALAAQGGLQGRAGISPSQAGLLSRNRFDAQAALEGDILQRNVDVQDRRRQALGNFLQGVEADEFGRSNLSRQQFGDALGAARADELARRQFNLEQQRRLLAGQQSLFFGGQGLQMARRNALRNFRLGNRQQNLAEQQANQQAQLFGNLAGQFAGQFGGGGSGEEAFA